MNIYVGNLSHSATESDLRTAFEKHGEVSRVNIPTDRETNQSRGFGFIEMPKSSEAPGFLSRWRPFWTALSTAPPRASS